MVKLSKRARSMDEAVCRAQRPGAQTEWGRWRKGVQGAIRSSCAFGGDKRSYCKGPGTAGGLNADPKSKLCPPSLFASSSHVPSRCSIQLPLRNHNAAISILLAPSRQLTLQAVQDLVHNTPLGGDGATVGSDQAWRMPGEAAGVESPFEDSLRLPPS